MCTHTRICYITLAKFDAFTACMHVTDDPVLLEKKRAGHFTSSVPDVLSALLTYTPWTTNHTHSEEHSAQAMWILNTNKCHQ